MPKYYVFNLSVIYLIYRLCRCIGCTRNETFLLAHAAIWLGRIYLILWGRQWCNQRGRYHWRWCLRYSLIISSVFSWRLFSISNSFDWTNRRIWACLSRGIAVDQGTSNRFHHASASQEKISLLQYSTNIKNATYQYLFRLKVVRFLVIQGRMSGRGSSKLRWRFLFLFLLC